MEVVPGRPLDQITLAELYQLAEEYSYQPGDLEETAGRVLEGHIEEIESIRNASLSQSFADLLQEQSDKA
jgi:hypothetical protein